MKLETFIEHHRLRQKRDGCGDLNAIGKRGTIYEYGSGLFAVTVMGAPSAQHWNTFRLALKGAGCRITQNGDEEGTAVFDPENAEQVRIALAAIHAFRKRKLSPEHRTRLIERLSRMRSFALETKSDTKDGVTAVSPSERDELPF